MDLVGGLGDLLECSICLEQLSQSNKVLPCQHTFCTQCLQDVFSKKGELLCPECRSRVEVDIKALPPNILVNRLLESMRQSVVKTCNPQPNQPSTPAINQQALGAISNQPSQSTFLLQKTPSHHHSIQLNSTSQPSSQSPNQPPANLFSQLAPQTSQRHQPTRVQSTYHSSKLNSASTPLTSVIADSTSSSFTSTTTNSTSSSSYVNQSLQSDILVPTRASVTPKQSDQKDLRDKKSGEVDSVVEGKCLVTFPQHMYQNITPQPIIKDLGKLSPWPSANQGSSPSTQQPAVSSSGPSLNSLMSTSLTGSGSTLVPTMEGSGSPLVSTMVGSSSPQVSSPVVGHLPPLANIMSPLFQNSSCSTLSAHASPIHTNNSNALPITGNLETNPFLDLLDSLPNNLSISKEGASVTGSPRHKLPTSPAPHSFTVAPPCHEKLSRDSSGAVPPSSTSVTSKEWQLSPRALLPSPADRQQAKSSAAGSSCQTQAADQKLKKEVHGTSGSSSSKSAAVAAAAKSAQKLLKQQQKQILQEIQLKAATGKQLPEHLTSVSGTFSGSPEWRVIDTPSSQGGSGTSTPGQTNSLRRVSDFGHQLQQQQQQPKLQQQQHRVQKLYKALYDYTATQKDELSLKRGHVYVVTEHCQDGWFRGKHLESGTSGVFPGNHLQHYQPNSQEEESLIELGGGEGQESDAERLEKLRKIRETLKKTHAQNVARSHSGAAGHVKSKGQRYRCVVPFPSSSEYEIELQVGDVISLVKAREDGWCKGILHRTGKTGLFPLSFVERI